MNEDNILEKFSKFRRHEFADWLWRGLRKFYASPPSKREDSFQYVGWQIMQYESICEGIAQIYEEYVPDSKQLLFRQAIGDVLRKHANDYDAPRDAIRDLIYLIIRIKANESLSALLPAVGNGFLGQLYPDILYVTITSLRSLAPSMQAYKTASGLIDSTNFDEGYLFEAIKVLVECKPTHVSRILVALEPRLSNLFRLAEAIRGDEWVAFCDTANKWVQFLLEYATLTWLSDFWEKADHTAGQLWLFKQIYCNEAIPTSFYHDRNTDKYVVKYANNEFPLKIPKKAYWTRDCLLEKSTYARSNRWSNRPDDNVYSKINEWVKNFNPYKDALECPT